MTEQAQAAIPAAPPAIAPAAPPAPVEREWNATEAARFLASRRNKQAEPAAAPEAAPEPPAQELTPEVNAAPQPEAPSETQAIEPEANLPPIEPPRSWTTAEKERFQTLPRETQEYVHTREQEREREVRRSQNEAAEIRKAAEAKIAEVEKQRQQYVEVLTEWDKSYERETAEKFPNIKSMEDLNFLANEAVAAANAGDATRASQIQAYLTAFNTHNQQWATKRGQLETAKNAIATEKQSKWTEHVRAENAKAAELIPDLADEKKGKVLQERAVARLNDLGFTSDELNKLATGEERISVYDHRLQQLIHSDLTLQEMRKASKTVAAQPLPPVQRPGVAKTPQSGNAQRIKALETQLATATGVNQAKLMAEIRQLRKTG